MFSRRTQMAPWQGENVNSGRVVILCWKVNCFRGRLRPREKHPVCWAKVCFKGESSVAASSHGLSHYWLENSSLTSQHLLLHLSRPVGKRELAMLAATSSDSALWSLRVRRNMLVHRWAVQKSEWLMKASPREMLNQTIMWWGRQRWINATQGWIWKSRHVVSSTEEAACDCLGFLRMTIKGRLVSLWA